MSSSILAIAILAARSELAVQVADTPVLVREAHQLRHQVYSLERGYLSSQDGLEIDGYDAHSQHVVLRLRSSGEVIGTARLILPLPGHERPGHRSFPMQGLCDPALFRQLPSWGTAELSRFAVSKERRGLSTAATSLARLALVRGLMQLSQAEGVTHLCATMECTLLRLLRASGIHLQRMGPMVDYHGPRQPVFCSIAAMLERMAQEQPAIWNYVTEYGQFTGAGANPALLHEPVQWRPEPAQRRTVVPSLIPGCHLAVQAEPARPPPHSQADAQAHELARV